MSAMRGESIAAIPIEVTGPFGERPVRNHCWRCGGTYNLRRIRMAYPEIDQNGNETMFAGYCGECRKRDSLTGQLIQGKITAAQFDSEWNAYCQKSSGLGAE